MFGFKDKKINSEEYEILLKKFQTLQAEMAIIKSQFKICWDNTENLRGKFNRQLGKIKPENEPEDAHTPEVLNSSFKIGL